MVLFRQFKGAFLALVLLGGVGLHVPFAPAVRAEGGHPASLIEGVAAPYKAPKIQGINAWINSPPLNLAKLKGKVVLIDFWTYSCVNCIRTLPHITEWDRKYRDKGLVIIGIHAPEFAFEKELENVKHAVQEHHIQYPVALDNQMVTWSNFNNMYWPAHYLINKNGNVVYEHFGEGEYERTENNIRALLGLEELKGLYNPLPKAEFSFSSFFNQQTPETYLGYTRTQHFKSLEPLAAERVTHYTLPNLLPLHAWALNGKWEVGQERITAKEKGAVLQLSFYAKKVFLVMGSQNHTPIPVTLRLNGQPLGAKGGKDVRSNQVVVQHNTLYELVNLDKAGKGLLEIETPVEGLEAYAFTFGG